MGWFSVCWEYLQVVQDAAARLLTKYVLRCQAVADPAALAPHLIESVLRFWFWLLDLCMDRHQHTSENFYIHTSSTVPWGHVIGLLAVLHTRLKTKGDRALAMVTPRLPLSLRSVVVVRHTAKISFFFKIFNVLAICCEALWTFSWKMLYN